MFCCTFDSETALRGDKLCCALNFHLPRDVSVYDAREVEEEFHPRYHAKGKRYVYRIWNGTQRHPVYDKYALWLKKPLDADALNAVVQQYVGTHDFAAFCGAGSDVQGSTERTIHACTVTRERDVVLFTVEGDGFLYNMVRIMVGTLLEIAAGRFSPDSISTMIEGRDRRLAGPTAPAHGLCLEQVFYE
jgi:tRNA pseudouridine38-40 synthase